MKLKQIEKRNIIELSCLIALIIICVVFLSVKNRVFKESYAIEEPKFKYLSDIEYIKNSSSVGWGQITLDQNLETKYNNGLISLIVNGQQKLFLKGISAHAISTLIYDISSYNYDYLSMYYGVDASRGTNGNGVKFSIYTSKDGENWDLQTPVSPPVKKGNSEAEFLNLKLNGAKYIKLYCHNNGNATADHCVYANAKLYKEGYVEDNAPYNFIKTLEEYDEILKKNEDTILQSNELALLQRKFVSAFGFELLQGIAHLDEERKNALEWLMTDIDALRYYITGGKPTGSYVNSLNVFFKLYAAYKNDLKDTTRTEYTVLGDLYKRMMISLSLTHSANVCLWVGGNQCSDAVPRYAVYKKMRKDNILVNKVFETLNIEEMRWVMNNNIDDEEIEWLNHHIRRYPTSTMPYNIDPYRYITYRFGYNYGLAQYYDENNYDSWNEKYHLSQYNITYQAGKPKLWIVFEQGSVCGGLSKTGSNINGSLGNPSAVIGQPGHAAYLEYSETSDGKGMWSIKNNISGWTGSEKSERLLCAWGSNNWDSYYQVSYVPYAQEALNDLENYNKALETMILADLYPDQLEKLERIYEKALEYQSINMDAWVGLIRTYQKNTAKTEEDYIELARRISESLYAFPLPMFDILNLINTNLQGTKYYATYTNYIRIGLEKGKEANAENTNVLQPSITRTMANYLLGNKDYSIASFSFDGEDAGKIKLGSKFEGNGVRWDYSLDNGTTWTATSESFVQLTKEEISKITEENDIKIHIVGVNYDPANIYTIDIKKATTPTHLFGNDLENRVVGVDLTYEWRNSESDAWTSYKTASPNNLGNKALYVRIGATQTFLPSDSLTFQFTEDNQPDTRKYIPVSHLSIHAVSTEAVNNGGRAAYAIDGNYNTRYHSAWNGTDTERYIVIKLDRPVILSAVEFVPAGGGNGKIYDGTIYGSADGENWEELAKETNIRYTNQANTVEEAIANTKSFEIEEPKQVQYVKIVANRTNGNWFAARAFNLYQDITKNVHPVAGIGYSTTEPTNKEVVARLVNPSVPVTITNNNGSDTYIFKENGEFTFEFVDENGITGSAKAKVDWIDKTPPTGKVVYSTTTKTREEVVATLTDLSEEVTVKNHHADEEEENENTDPFSFTFSENGTHIFEIEDRAGNVTKIEATVSWIDLEPPTVELSYDKETLTNQDVTVTLVNESEEIKVLNNNNSKSYTFHKNGSFEFIVSDIAGNVTRITASVGWIDKTAPTANIEYNITEKTKNPVIAKLVGFSEDVIILNNDGKQEYTFMENGEFNFEIEDKAGNKNRITAKVDWIEKENKPENPGKPSEPENPSNPEEPSNPENPSNPEEPSNPENPSNPEEPSNPENPSNPEEPSNPENPSNPEEPNVPTKVWKTIINGNFSVRVKSSEENLNLKIKRLSLNEKLKAKVASNNYDYYELKLNENNETMTISFEYPSGKTIKSVYFVTDNEVLKQMEYKKTTKNEIEIETSKLGKILFVYEEEKQSTVTEEKKTEYTYLLVIIGVLAIINVVLIIDRIRRRKK